MKHTRIISIGLSALMLVSLCALCVNTGATAATSTQSAQTTTQEKSTDIVGAPLVGQLLATTGPAVTSWAQGRLDLFVIGTDHALWHKYWLNGWSSWESLGGYLTSSPGAVSWGNGRIDIFARGGEGHCWHLWWQDGSGWGKWEDVGGQLLQATGPAVSSWASGRLDVFVTGANDHNLWHKYWQNGWGNWEPIGVGYIESSPAAVSWGVGRIDIFANIKFDPREPGSPYHQWWQDGSGWGRWEGIQGAARFPTGPAVSSWAQNRLDVFFIGWPDYNLWHKAWSGSLWTNWESLGGVLTSSPAAVSWGQGRIDIFARGNEGHLWHQWWQDGSGWGRWEDVGAPPLLVPTGFAGFAVSTPSIVADVSGRLVDQNGGLAGRTVTIYYGENGLTSHIDTTTLSDGSFLAHPPSVRYYLAKFAGDPPYAASQSSVWG